MGYRLSYVIPSEELAPSAVERLRMNAVLAGLERALVMNAIASYNQAIIREVDNVADFAAGPGGWLTMPLLVIGVQYGCIATAVPGVLTPALGPNQVAVFYKVGVEVVIPPVNLLSFREGAAAGTTYSVFDLEGLFTKQCMDGYFSEPVTYDPSRVINVVATARIATLAQARVRLGCFIIEPGGPVVSPA